MIVYSYGVNMPGYLPQSDDCTLATTIEVARLGLADVMDCNADDLYDGWMAEDEAARAEPSRRSRNGSPE